MLFLLLLLLVYCADCSACSAGGGAEETWRLEGIGAPHDIAVTASPMPVRGTGDRAIALFVAETKPSDSWLRKFLFVPPGQCTIHAYSRTTKPLLNIFA